MTQSLRTTLRDGLHLAALWALAVAQPLFDLLGRTPEFFVVRGSTEWDVVLFALAITVLPPLALCALEVLVGAGSAGARRLLHLVLVGILVALIAVQALKRVGGAPDALVLALAACLGGVAVLLYARAHAIRLLVTVLAPAPLLFLVLFLLNSPVSSLGEARAGTLGSVAADTPVVVVVLDELPLTSLLDERREIDPIRYPSLASLAADATWFRNTTTVHEHSTAAVPAILTGVEPEQGLLPVLGDHPDNLFTLLGGTYRMHVVEPVTHLCPDELCPREQEPFGSRMGSLFSDLGVVYLHVSLPDGLAESLPPVDQTWQDFGDAGDARELGGAPVADSRDVDHVVGRGLWQDQRAAFESFVAGIEPSRRPTLHFLHALLPHSPWRFLPSGRQYGDSLGIDGLAEDRWTEDEWLVTQGWQRHLLQVGFVDRLLGRLLARLRETGLYDRALVVVTADHGVSFLPGERRRGVTPGNVHDIALVPLLVKEPGQREGRVVDEHARTIDILPTIADALGLRLPWRADGRSLLGGGGAGGESVTVQGRTNEGVEASEAALVARAERTLERKIALFGSGDEAGLFTIGPRRELLGRSLSSLPARTAQDASAEVHGQVLLSDVDPDSALSPSHVAGSVDGLPADMELALAVNGTIAATTRTFRAGGDVRFSAFVPETAFRAGANAVEVLAIRPGGLERLGGTGRTAGLRLTAAAIVSDAGERIPIVPGAVQGLVEDWFVESESVRFGGWAAQERPGRLADRVLVFSRGRLLYSGATSVERRDIGRRLGNRGLDRSGFVFELPHAAIGRDAAADLRFFGVAGGRASELDYHPDFPWRRS